MKECAVKTYATRSGRTLHYRACQADNPHALVVALHGIQSHGEWYVDGAGHLASRGYSVALLDRRGSGLNKDDRGHAPSAKTLLDDIDDALDEVNAAGLPVALMGISWGGKLAALYASQRGERLSALVLSAPGIAAKVDLAFPQKVLVGLCTLFAPRKLLAIPIPDATYFTANPPRLAYIEKDALGLRRATARFFAVSRMIDRALARGVSRIRVPTFMVLAGNERIVDNERLRAFYDALRCPKSLRVFEEAHHTLEFEPDPTPYLEAVCSWLDGVFR